MTLHEYKEQLANLKIRKDGKRMAPHKAILLISIMDLIEEGLIDTPFIPLCVTLERKFERNWKKYVPADSVFQCKMCYPFYHMSSSPFWSLVKLPTFEKRQEYSSPAMLKKSFAGATISDDLFKLFKERESRDEIRNLLIKTYLTPGNQYPSITDIASMAAECSMLCAAVIAHLIA